MQKSIDVRVIRYTRKDAASAYDGELADQYSAVVNDEEPYHLPVHIISKDAAGNPLAYIGCVVRPTKRVSLPEEPQEDAIDADFEVMPDPPKSKRTRKPKQETPVLAAPTPEPAPKPKRARTARNEESQPVVVRDDIPPIKTKKPRAPKSDLSDVFAFIKTL